MATGCGDAMRRSAAGAGRRLLALIGGAGVAPTGGGWKQEGRWRRVETGRPPAVRGNRGVAVVHGSRGRRRGGVDAGG